MVTGRPITAKELLAQSEWVRQLARRIVFDEDGADDVVQELHLAVWALRHLCEPFRNRARIRER